MQLHIHILDELHAMSAILPTWIIDILNPRKRLSDENQRLNI